MGIMDTLKGKAEELMHKAQGSAKPSGQGQGQEQGQGQSQGSGGGDKMRHEASQKMDQAADKLNEKTGNRFGDQVEGAKKKGNEMLGEGGDQGQHPENQ